MLPVHAKLLFQAGDGIEHLEQELREQRRNETQDLKIVVLLFYL
jgi:hypothetical protein